MSGYQVRFIGEVDGGPWLVQVAELGSGAVLAEQRVGRSFVADLLAGGDVCVNLWELEPPEGYRHVVDLPAAGEDRSGT